MEYKNSPAHLESQPCESSKGVWDSRGLTYSSLYVLNYIVENLPETPFLWAWDGSKRSKKSARQFAKLIRNLEPLIIPAYAKYDRLLGLGGQ